MARPTRRKRSSNIQFRERIPHDVLDQVRGRELTIRVGESVKSVRVGSKAKEIYLSLRTSDPAEAKARHSAVQSHLANVYLGLRLSAPITLSHTDCVAIAGDFYRAWVKEELGGAGRGGRFWLADHFCRYCLCGWRPLEVGSSRNFR
jgi:hypothetical protein